MKALLIVDVQNDFCPGGALEVPNGDEVIPPINALQPYFECIIQTQDWHPENHSSFASNIAGKNPFETIKVDYGEQVLWPNHCVQGSPGAEFHPNLNTDAAQLIIRKGFRPHIDSYSAFFENDRKTTTGLHGFLQERGIKEIYITGLATDFCVKWSALDAVERGYKVWLIEDAVRGIDMNNSVEMSLDEMRSAGVTITPSKKLIEHFD